MAGTLSERLANGALVLSDTAQIKSQFPEWLRREIEDASKLMSEAAELARKVEDSILVEITESQQLPGTADYDYGDMIAAVMQFKPGARVALVEVGDCGS